jgi:hypothetical protein
MLRKFLLFIVFLLFSFTEILGFVGVGSSDNPFEISNCLELNEVRNYSGFSFELVNNIDCSDTFNWSNSYGTGFEPIGDYNNEFSGEFFGNGFGIYNLFINVTRDNVGFFGRVNHLNLNYFSLENLLVLANGSNVGGVVGYSESSTNFDNLKVSGSVLSSGNNVGGIIGAGISSNIFTSYFVGMVFGNDFVGGITGSNSGTVKDSFSIVNLSAESNFDPIGSSGLFVNNYWLNFTDFNYSDVISGVSVLDENYFNSLNVPLDVWGGDFWNFSSDGLPELVFVENVKVLPIDNLVGSHLDIDSNIFDLSVSGTSSWISNSSLSLDFFKGENKIYEVTRNLSENILNMSNVVFNEVLNMSEHSLVVSGFDLDLELGDFSNLFFKLHNSLTFKDEICVKDSKFSLVDEVSVGCLETDEFLFSNLSLMFENDLITNSNIIISWENYSESILKIEGLNNSVVIQTLVKNLNNLSDLELFNLTGVGSINNPYKIYSCLELDQVRFNLDSYFELMENINCNGFDFLPIGDIENKFTGGFFGNKFKIMYLGIDSSNFNNSDYVGLFGVGDYVEVSNLYLENLDIESEGDFVGGLFGSVSNSNINNVIVSGSISGSDYVGGLVGSSNLSNIYTSYFSGSVSGSDYVGGVVGENLGSIEDSFSVVTLTGDSYVDGIGYGGLFSNNYFFDESDEMEDFFNGVNVSSENYFYYLNAPVDSWDLEIWNFDFKSLPNFDFTDEDSDGVKDVIDRLVGDNYDIDTNVDDIVVEGTSDWVEDEELILTFSYDDIIFLEIEKDLSIYPFYMENLVIEIENNSYENSILLNGFDLKGDESKIIYFNFNEDDNFDNSICIRDEEINSISKISDDCDLENEFFFEEVISMEDGELVSIDYINISWENYDDRIIKIEGLNNSAVVQFVKIENYSSSTYSSSSSIFSNSSISSSRVLPISESDENIVFESKNIDSNQEDSSEKSEPILEIESSPNVDEDLNTDLNETFEDILEENNSNFTCSFWKCKMPVGAVALWLIW